MKLYGYYRSSTSYRVRIALNLKGLTYRQIAVNLASGEQSTPAFAALNAHQTLPLLEYNNQRLVQSLAIIDWLETHYPDPAFSPTALVHAQICRELYYAIATEIHAPNNLPVLNYLKTEFNADQHAVETWYAQWVRRTFSTIEKRLADLDWLGESFPFGGPSLFEIVLIPQLYNARRWNTDLSAFPLLIKIDKACATLPAFERAHPNNQPDAPTSRSEDTK